MRKKKRAKNKKFFSKKTKSFLQLFSIIIILILSAIIIDRYMEFFNKLIQNNIYGLIIYLIIEITSIVIAPITTTPLIIVASKTFGWLQAGIYSLFGWIVGSLIAFWIARRYGRPVVKRIVNLEKFEKLGDKISTENSYMGLIFIRIIFPVDLLSYFLGLFSKISMKKFLITTSIGLIPMAFGFAYIGIMSLKDQIVFAFVIGLLAAVIWITSIAHQAIINKVRKKK